MCIYDDLLCYTCNAGKATKDRTLVAIVLCIRQLAEYLYQ